MKISKKNCTRYTDCRKKNAWLDAEDAKKATEADKKTKAKKDKTIKERAVTIAAGMTTVGPNGKDSKSTLATNESIQKNLASQTSTFAPASSGHTSGTLGCFQSNWLNITVNSTDIVLIVHAYIENIRSNN